MQSSLFLATSVSSEFLFIIANNTQKQAILYSKRRNAVNSYVSK